MSKNYILKTEDNENINITTYGNENANAALIFVHGFKGFKDWGFWPYAAQKFTEENFYIISFNFSLNGVSGNGVDFDELDKFAKNTITRETKELNLVINNLKEGKLGSVKQDIKIGVIGHSRGGGVTALISDNENIDAITLWASVSRFDRYSKRQKKEWIESGVFSVKNARTGQIMSMNAEHIKDITENSEGSLSIKNKINKYDKPLLILHGEQDLAVKVNEAKELYSWSKKENCELVILPATGHTFDIKHPFDGSNEKFETVLNKSVEFFKNHLL